MKLRFLAALAWAVSANAGAGASYSDVSAILNAHCVVCHRGEAAPLGLRLDSHAALMRGSSRGPVVQPSTTQAPACDRVLANCAPRPLEAPVIRATRPSRLLE